MDRDFKDILPMDYLVDRDQLVHIPFQLDVLSVFQVISRKMKEILKNTFHKHMNVLEATG